jgi:hypothetical protein
MDWTVEGRHETRTAGLPLHGWGSHPPCFGRLAVFLSRIVRYPAPLPKGESRGQNILVDAAFRGSAGRTPCPTG